MEIVELLESETEGLQILREISNRYPKDADVQRLTTRGALAAAERIQKLNLLLLYKDDREDAKNDTQP